ncbi:MAG: hypothetical protein LBV47_08910 [Bacteroidales bacterium]|jgi:hypothetical protein|nr:hypothetical protein [Bacteroidales bacterium]
MNDTSTHRVVHAGLLSFTKIACYASLTVNKIPFRSMPSKGVYFKSYSEAVIK